MIHQCPNCARELQTSLTSCSGCGWQAPMRSVTAQDSRLLHAALLRSARVVGPCKRAD